MNCGQDFSYWIRGRKPCFNSTCREYRVVALLTDGTYLAALVAVYRILVNWKSINLCIMLCGNGSGVMFSL